MMFKQKMLIFSSAILVLLAGSINAIPDEREPCDHDYCHPNSTCISVASPDQNYTCVCKTGFAGNGTVCEDINECNQNPNCSQNALCHNTVGSFTCSCRLGYTGDGFTCNDLQGCNADCPPYSTCVDVGMYSCTCNPGFTGNSTVCEDIDECAIGADNCHVNANCSNILGSYTCACKKGFSGDGVTCEDVDECALGSDSCHDDANCTNNVGSYTCQCKEGFTGNGVDCQDIICDADCPPNSICTEDHGMFGCTCNVGFTGNGTVCEEIREPCDHDHCNYSYSYCTTDLHSVGGYACICKNGFSGNGTVCEDIDECNQNVCHIHASCQNVVGSFTCSCNPGYIGDGIKCFEVSTPKQTPTPVTEGPCFTYPFLCHAEATCNEMSGNIICTCKSGYTGNGTLCNDINECNSNPCHQKATCHNSPGSFSCACDFGFTGDGTHCFDINECHNNPCHEKATCRNFPSNFTCTCDYGFTGNGTECFDINECTATPNVCHESTVCENTVGGHICKCRTGHIIVENICKAVKTYVGRLSIKNLAYLPIYNNTKSNEYIALRNTLKNAIQNLYQNTSYGDFVVDVLISRIYNGSIGVDYEVIFNSTATNITAQSLNTQLEQVVNKANGTIGNSLVLGKIEGGRLFIIEDKNECTTEDLCVENAVCNNTDGSFVCRCDSGYSGDGFVCTDINECTATLNVCHESTVCENTVGGHICKCRTGHIIVENICKAVKTYVGRLLIKNLPYLPIYNNTKSNEYITLRNTLKNAIKDLYQNTSYGDFVVDVLINRIYNGSVGVNYDVIFNSTATNITAQSLNTQLEQVVNKANGTIGNSLVLGKIEGDRLFIIEDKDECITEDSCDENAVCNNTDGSFVCGCDSGYFGDGFVCTDINECSTAPCHKNATCLNTAGLYNCSCNVGFQGDGYNCGGLNCSVLSCGKNKVCVKRNNLFYCDEKKDDDDDDLSSGVIAVIVIIPTIAFISLVVALIIIQRRTEKNSNRLRQPPSREGNVTLERITTREREFVNKAYKDDYGMQGLGRV